MNSKNMYVPILKWKAGEQRALEGLPVNERKYVMPLIEIIPNNNEVSTKEYIIDNMQKVCKFWSESPCFIDIFSLLEYDIDEPEHPLIVAYNTIRNSCSPIFIINKDIDKASLRALCGILSNKKQHIAIKLYENELDDDGILDKLNAILEKTNLTTREVHIILDFQDISSLSQKRLAKIYKRTLLDFPLLDKWASITIAASNFPNNLSEFEVGVSSLPRTEWLSWNDIINDNQISNICKFWFGDYAINGVYLPPEYQPYMAMSANIRYTTSNEWIIFKGRSVRSLGFEQFPKICNDIINSDLYYGKNFSLGDLIIYQCAKGEVGTGNATTWRKVGTSHHISVVASQIASLP